MRSATMIVGSGRSGSTLLAFLLNAHPSIVSTGEVAGPIHALKDPSTFPCSCGDALEDCRFWRRFSSAMGERGLQFGPHDWGMRFGLAVPGIPSRFLVRPLPSEALTSLRDALVLAVPSWRRELTRIAERNRAFFEVAAEITGKPAFVDASKGPGRVQWIQRLTDLRPRIIHLVRDAPAYVASHLKRKSRSLDSAVKSWLTAASRVEQLWRDVEAERKLRLRYEDLCTDTAAELDRLAEFIGVAPYPGRVHFRETEHHILGNRMRLQSSDEVMLDDSWKQTLTPAEAKEVSRRTRRYRRLFGYA